MLLNVFILLIIVNVCFCTTSIKSYPTIDLKENVPLNTNLIDLKTKSKLILLNLSGFEKKLFSIINSTIYTINIIDREQLIGEKRCFDRLYCLIELHILVNDGEQYWVIPIHIIDENDNKPRFEKSSIDLKFHENIPGGYKIAFGGAIDIDEGLNGKIRYKLECFIKSSNELLNCYPLFELIILSQSFISYDQLALKYLPSLSSSSNDQYKLILYAIDSSEKEKQLQSSMILNIEIEKEKAEEIKFSLSEYKFILTNIQIGTIIGQVKIESNEKIFYKIINQTTNQIEINSVTGQLTILNQNLISRQNQIKLIIQGENLFHQKTFTNVLISIRLFEYLNNISFQYENISSQISKSNYSNSFLINQNISTNEILFNLTIISFYYPLDQYILLLENYLSLFSLTSSNSFNSYLLKTRNDLLRKSIYVLKIKVKHQLTEQWLTDLVIQFSFIDQSTSTHPTINLLDMEKSSSSIICLENSTYILRDFDKNSVGIFRVIQSNLNISSFSNSFILINQSEIIVDQCRMHIDQLNNNLNNSQYEFCSFDYCYNLTLINEEFHLMKMKNEIYFSKWIFPIRPIEIAMFTLSIVFLIGTITLILIICRLKGVQFCLTIKNYLFYGKKYGLSNAQRLSSSKMTQQIHSIVVRESRSPSIEQIKTKPYIFNIDHLIEQETDMYSHPCSEPISLSLTSSLQRGERTRSNVKNEITPRRLSSSFVQETKQLLETVSLNQDLDMSRLASEV